MNSDFSGRPRLNQYWAASLKAISVAAAPGSEKKILLRDWGRSVMRRSWRRWAGRGWGFGGGGSGFRVQRSEVRGQRSEVRGQRSEVRGQRSEGRGQRAEGRGQRAEVGCGFRAATCGAGNNIGSGYGFRGSDT